MKKVLFMLSAVVFAAFATSCQKGEILNAEQTAVQTVNDGDGIQNKTKLAFETLEKFKNAPGTNSTRDALESLFSILVDPPFMIGFSHPSGFVISGDISKLYGNYTYSNGVIYKIDSDNDSIISLIYNQDLLTTYQFDIYLDEFSSRIELPFELLNYDAKVSFDNSYVMDIRKNDVLISKVYLQGAYSNVAHLAGLMYTIEIYDETDTITPDNEKEPILYYTWANISNAGSCKNSISIVDCETDASIGCYFNVPNSAPERSSTESVNSWLFNYAKILIGKFNAGTLFSIPLEGELFFNIDECVIPFSIDDLNNLINGILNNLQEPEDLARILNANITASCDEGNIYFGLNNSGELEAYVDIQDGEDILLSTYLVDCILEYFLGNDD